MSDYLSLADLLVLGLSARQTDWLRQQSQITGHGGEPVAALPPDTEDEEDVQ